MVKEKINNEWPDSVREMAGTWDSFPSASELNQADAKDAKREDF